MNEITGWDELVEQFPENFEEIAQKHNVMKGARQDKDLLKILIVLMIHLGLGYSLKESALRAKKEGLCNMSSVARRPH